MINTEKFTKRLQKVIDFYGESASSFSDKVGVQRSSISHILSGRNKPSLDFVLKVLSAYPEVELYWLLNGKGSFPNKSQPPTQKVETEKSVPPLNTLKPKIDTNKKIERIVIFYDDGTFENYRSND